MGKRIISQRRGKGGSTYRSPSHRDHGDIRHPRIEKARGIVKDIVHAPGVTAPLALVRYESGKEFFMLAADGLKVGQEVRIGPGEIGVGNTMPVKHIPEGTFVYNVEARPGDGGRFVRSGGTSAIIVSHGEKTMIQLPSGKLKALDPNCRATIGVIAGSGRPEKPFAKSGKKFHAYKSKAKRYFKVRGIAMNPVDHPHGGGAHQHIGTQSSVSKHAPPGRKVGRIASKKKRRR